MDCVTLLRYSHNGDLCSWWRLYFVDEKRQVENGTYLRVLLVIRANNARFGYSNRKAETKIEICIEDLTHLEPETSLCLFDIHHQTVNSLPKTIEATVYNERRVPIPGQHCFLGRVRIPCSNTVKKGEEAYERFQLQK